MTLWIGTSWKMTKTLAEARRYAEALRDDASVRRPGVRPFVLPPVTALATVADVLRDTTVSVGAQDAHWEDAGAWTGEVSAAQVADAGARILEIGHSERRAHFGETDERVGLKVLAAVRHGMIPLVCVGEDAAERSAGAATDRVLAQVEAALAKGLPPGEVLVAYEPVWAIGVQGAAADPADVAPVVDAVRRRFPGLRGVLYGGAVTTTNGPAMLDAVELDGLFVGRAAWEVEGLVTLVHSAADRVETARV
jgi:L-erythrulose 1-phosphate isomerase